MPLFCLLNHLTGQFTVYKHKTLLVRTASNRQEGIYNPQGILQLQDNNLDPICLLCDTHSCRGASVQGVLSGPEITQKCEMGLEGKDKGGGGEFGAMWL